MPCPRLLATLTAGLTAVALAACGSSSDSGTAAKSSAPSKPAASSAGVAVGAGITQARLGDATSAAAHRALRLLSHGGVVKPGARLPGHAKREGVGAATDCEGIDDTPTAATIATGNAAILCLLNAVRTSEGLPVFTPNAQLADAATAYARAMVAGHFFSHTGADGSSMVDRIRTTGYLTGDWTVGENLALGGGALSTPRAIVESWLNSAGHRANIESPDYHEIGLGIAIGMPIAGSDGGATYVNEFGTHSTDEAAAAADTSTTPDTTSTTPTSTAAKRRVPCSRRHTRRARRACRATAARRAAAARARARLAAG